MIIKVNIVYALCLILLTLLEICEDVQEECSKFGQVIDLKIPRPTGGSRQSAGVGKIFVKFDTTASAKKALQSLAGRKFADRTVVTTYFPEVSISIPEITNLSYICLLCVGELRGSSMVMGKKRKLAWVSLLVLAA